MRWVAVNGEGRKKEEEQEKKIRSELVYLFSFGWNSAQAPLGA